MQYGKTFRSQHKLTSQQHRIMEDITFCRTLGMGGHHLNCDHCDHMDISYNSCRNRHCPKCGALNKARWLEARISDLLPVPYAHGVFTLPHELNPLIMYNKKLILNALFRTVNATLKAFAQNDQYKHGLKGDLGYTTVLHTWNQKLFPHFHLHCIIPSGVYRPDEEQWIPTKYRFLFPVKALSEVFKGKMVSFLRRAYKSNQLVFPKRIAHLQQKETFSGLLSTLMDKNWVVYCKTPFKSPKFVLDYLGRYTHRDNVIPLHQWESLGQSVITGFFPWTRVLSASPSKTAIKTTKRRSVRLSQMFLSDAFYATNSPVDLCVSVITGLWEAQLNRNG